MAQPTASTVDYSVTWGKFVRTTFVRDPRGAWLIEVQYRPGILGGRDQWTAVELDEFGNFRRRLFDSRG